MYEKEVYHFLVLHFPIALFTTGYIFNFMGLFIKKSEFLQFTSWMMGMGIFWGIISIITGFITDWDMGNMETPFPIQETHGSLMITCIIYFIILFYLYNNKKINDKFLLLLHSVGILMLMYGAHLGALWADRL